MKLDAAIYADSLTPLCERYRDRNHVDYNRGESEDEEEEREAEETEDEDEAERIYSED